MAREILGTLVRRDVGQDWPVDQGDPAPNSGAWPVRTLLGGKATFSGPSGSVTTGTAANAVASVGYLFHPASVTKRYQLIKILLSWNGGSGGSYTIRLTRITGENATPGGSLLTPAAHDPADTSMAVFRGGATGAPTRDAVDAYSLTISGGATGMFEINAAEVFDGKGYSMRAGFAEGWEIRTVVAGPMTTGAAVGAVLVWTEE